MGVNRAPYALAPPEASSLGAHLPPHLYPPAGAQPKNLVGYEPVPAPGASVVLFTFQVPVGMRLVLNQIGNNFFGGGFKEGSGQLIYQIQDNGDPIEDFEQILGSLGNVAQPSWTAPIIIEESHTVSFVLQNTAGSGILGGSGIVGATLRGWYYNRIESGEGEWAV